MGSWSRKLRKAVETREDETHEGIDTVRAMSLDSSGRFRDVLSADEFRAYLEVADDVGEWVRKAAKAAGRPTVEMAVALVHKSNEAWLSHLGSSGWLTVEAYEITPVFKRAVMASVHPDAARLLEAAYRAAMRHRPINASLALVVDPGGGLRALSYQLPTEKGAQRFEETSPDNHMGFDD